LEQVKWYYETHDESLEMIEEKLWMLVASAMDTSIKIKWLERWKKSLSFYDALKFSKPKFNNINFLE